MEDRELLKKQVELADEERLRALIMEWIDQDSDFAQAGFHGATPPNQY